MAIFEPILALLKHSVEHRLIMPWIVRHGWLPPGFMNFASTPPECAFGYDNEAEIKHKAALVTNDTPISFYRLATLWHQVRYLDRSCLSGDLVECGVYRGGASAFMALAHLQSAHAPTRILHLFDSFKGLPEPRAELDGDLAMDLANGLGSGALRPIGVGAAPIDRARTLLEEEIGYPSGLIRYHEGWFQDTLPHDHRQIGDIALLRLDADWYDSTLVCLEYLYPKVVSGGIVVVDDYGHYAGCKRAVEEFIGTQSNSILLHHIDYSGRYWIKP